MIDAGPHTSPRSLFAGDGRTVIVAMDHALAAGQVAPLDRPVPLVKQVLAGEPDGLILTEGMRRLVPPRGRVPWLLTADYYATSVMPGASGDEELHRFLWTVEDAKQRGAAGLKCLLVFGRRDPQELVKNIANVTKLITESQRVGLPVMVEATLWGTLVPEIGKNSAADVANAARVAFELGADIIKIPIPDDMRMLEQLSAALPVPLVLMGGPQVDPMALFATLRDAMDAGARGLALGRNVWSSENPTTFVRALRMIVHDGVSAAAALEFLRDEQHTISWTNGALTPSETS